MVKKSKEDRKIEDYGKRGARKEQTSESDGDKRGVCHRHSCVHLLCTL